MTNTPLDPLPDEPADRNEPVNPPVRDDDPVNPEVRYDDDDEAMVREPEPGAVPPESTNG